MKIIESLKKDDFKNGGKVSEFVERKMLEIDKKYRENNG